MMIRELTFNLGQFQRRCLMLSIPSVTNSGTPMGDLCLNEKIGTVAPYGDTEKIAEAILEAYQMEVEPKPSNDKHEFQNVIERLIV